MMTRMFFGRLTLGAILFVGAGSQAVFAQQGFVTEAQINANIETYSSLFLGRAYADGPLGEGLLGEYDHDPLLDLNHFDCTTYIETVLAAAMAKDFSDDQIIGNLNRIRYHNGKVGYVTRNHFIDADWIPNNAWILQDITATLAGEQDVGMAEALVDKAGWYAKADEKRLSLPDLAPEEQAKALAKLRVAGMLFKPKIVKIPYLKLSSIFDDEGNVKNERALRAMPNVSIISIIRPNWNLKNAIGTNMNVSHQGIVIRKDDGLLYLRHASSVGNKQVSEVLFTDYLKAFIKSPTIKGFNVLMVHQS